MFGPKGLPKREAQRGRACVSAAALWRASERDAILREDAADGD